MAHDLRLQFAAIAFAALSASAAAPASAQQQPPPAPGCPLQGWQENLVNFQKPDAAFPTQYTPVSAPDCNFHQWSFEAFVWATALDSNGVPRFLTLPTEDDLLSTAPEAAAPHPRELKLAARSPVDFGLPGYTTGAGSFVEADGNVLIAPNGYPVYDSVHMNPAYFAVAKQNLIVNGGYQNQPQGSTFPVGSAVFKATWLRLAPGEQAPAGAYTTQAQVPVLTVLRTKTSIAIVPVPGQFVTVTVALIGLHVVGETINHQEFLWGTFEHTLDAPAVPDNTFTTSGSNPNNFTFYRANTSFAQVNLPFMPPLLTFSPATQRFSPTNNAVLENQTGGENFVGPLNQPWGVGNVLAVNGQGQSFLANEKPPQSVFANYNLVGTVWMAPNSYNLTSNQTNALGSVTLANVTAETYVQVAKNTPISQVYNCFLCHNPTSYSFQSNPPPLANRLIAISHALAVGTPYAVPNAIIGRVAQPLR
jgi:hypothetical protein